MCPTHVWLEAVKAAAFFSSFAVSSQAPVEVEDELVASEGLDLSSDSSDSESEEEPVSCQEVQTAHHRQSGFNAF